MLLVKTYLAQSLIDGIGLFAGEDIKVGTKIYEIDDIFTRIFSQSEYNEALEKNREFSLKYIWKSGDKYYISLDNDRFMNHSDNPNTYETVDSTYAKIDIKKGEEITSNYNDFCQIGLNFDN